METEEELKRLASMPHNYDKTEPKEDPDARINAALRCLSEREMKVLVRRLGLLGERPHTFKEIGEWEKVTGARCRELYLRGLRRFRKPAVYDLMMKSGCQELIQAFEKEVRPYI